MLPSLLVSATIDSTAVTVAIITLSRSPLSIFSGDSTSRLCLWVISTEVGGSPESGIGSLCSTNDELTYGEIENKFLHGLDFEPLSSALLFPQRLPSILFKINLLIPTALVLTM